MQTVTLARHAMATRFEIVLHGENATRLQGAGDAALAEVERVEAQLSIFRPSSEIARVNARAAHEPVRVTPSVFRLIQHTRQLHQETEGAFDITIAPLVRCWGFMEGRGSMPDDSEVERVRHHIGMQHVVLDEENFTVRFDDPNVMFDFGAIGKGYAIDQAVAILREAGITSALLHGGTSTVYGLGQPPGGEPWKVAIESPPRTDAGSKWLATVPLRDEALSVSAVWGKSFEQDGQIFGHVLDPRSGRPVSKAVMAAVVLPSATETDALSTALLVGGYGDHEKIARLRPQMRIVVVGPKSVDYPVLTTGVTLKSRESIEKLPGNG